MDCRLADCTDRDEIAAVVAVQRDQLFKASAVIEMCRYACASKFEGFDPEQLAMALQAVDDLISGAVAALELVTGDEERHEATVVSD